MYAWGKILWAGGGHPLTTTAEIIDANAASPAWQWTGSMNHARQHFNLTLLPDGKVLATGGDDGSENAVLATEMWDPATGAWSVVAPKTVFHGYHSTAVLVPDGRVFSGGGDPEESKFVEIYSPPYLFKGTRPTITAAPATIAPDQTYFVGTPDAASITKVSLLATGSVTHGQNMSQRYDTLTFTQTAGGVNVTIPPGASRTPPGHYMLFILNGDGVPSVGALMRRPSI